MCCHDISGSRHVGSGPSVGLRRGGLGLDGLLPLGLDGLQPLGLELGGLGLFGEGLVGVRSLVLSGLELRWLTGFGLDAEEGPHTVLHAALLEPLLSWTERGLVWLWSRSPMPGSLMLCGLGSWFGLAQHAVGLGARAVVLAGALTLCGLRRVGPELRPGRLVLRRLELRPGLLLRRRALVLCVLELEPQHPIH